VTVKLSTGADFRAGFLLQGFVPSMAQRSFTRKILRWFACLAALWVGGTLFAVFLLRFIPPITSSFMIARSIEAIVHREQDFHLDYRWIPIEKISPHLAIAVVASEDQKFPTHRGFDVEAIRSVLDQSGNEGPKRGASTISQQVAKNLFLWSGRSYLRKGLEAYFTVLIEWLWPKERILEVYLNIAEFGDGIYGAGAASERYFRATPARLDTRQAALLAAVLPNPRRLHADRPSAYVQRRADWIQRQTRQLGGADYLHP
jgi:monofunctional biosynthetic peptidoglycan transglycosylase